MATSQDSSVGEGDWATRSPLMNITGDSLCWAVELDAAFMALGLCGNEALAGD
jgi:hypothetical protein